MQNGAEGWLQLLLEIQFTATTLAEEAAGSADP